MVNKLLLKRIKRLQRARATDNDDLETEILEQMEDAYGKDLSKFYGEDFNSKKTVDKLFKKLKESQW